MTHRDNTSFEIMSLDIQLEFNLEDKTPEELKIYYLEKQMHEMHESLGKMRRRMFAEIGELKKVFAKVLSENELLKSKVMELKNEREDWTYGQDGYLFNVRGAEENRGRLQPVSFRESPLPDRQSTWGIHAL